MAIIIAEGLIAALTILFCMTVAPSECEKIITIPARSSCV